MRGARGAQGDVTGGRGRCHSCRRPGGPFSCRSERACMHTCAHKHTCTRMYTRTHTLTHAHTAHTCTPRTCTAPTHVHIHAHTCTHPHTCTYMHTRTCTPQGKSQPLHPRRALEGQLLPRASRGHESFLCEIAPSPSAMSLRGGQVHPTLRPLPSALRVGPGNGAPLSLDGLQC